MFLSWFLAFLAVFSNSSIIQIFEKKSSLDFSNSKFVKIMTVKYHDVLSWFYLKASFFDFIVRFCLHKPSKKIIVILILFIITNPFLRKTFFANFFYIPLLCGVFFIVLLNILNSSFEENDRKLFLFLFISFFFIKLVYSLSSPIFFLAEDELSTYDELSWRITKSWFRDSIISFNPSSETFLSDNIALPKGYYYKFNALIYYFFGHHFLISRLFALFLHSSSSILIYFISQKIFNTRTALISFVLFSVSPEIGFWSLALLREGPLIFLILSFFLSLLMFFRNLGKSFFRTFFYLFLTFLVFYVSFFTRNYVASLLLVSFLLGLSFVLLKNSNLKFNKIHKVCLPLILIFLILFQPFINKQFYFIKDSKSFFTSLDFYRNQDTDPGRLAFYTGADISSIRSALRFLPIGLIYAIFSVIPSEVKSLDLWIFFTFNTVFWYFLLFFIFLGIVFALRDSFLESIPIITFCFLLLIFTALVEGNFGNLLRHSVQFKAPLLIFAAYGLHKTFPEKFYLKYFKTKKLKTPDVSGSLIDDEKSVVYKAAR